MSSLWDDVRDKERRRLEAQQRLDGVEVPDETRVVLGPDPGRPKPNWWYVYMMKKRLEWPKCEDRETVIALFRSLWPAVGRHASEYYDTAAADPRTAAELLHAYGATSTREVPEGDV